MNRFFVSSNQINHDTISIQGDDFKHITKVLRLGKDAEIEVCDGKSREYRVRIQALAKDGLIGKIIEEHHCLGENEDFEITLFQALAKGPKLEMIIQKSVELGVFQIYPFSCVRAVVELGKKEAKKSERWQRIAYEAAKQSKRGIIPQVGPILEIAQIIKRLGEFDLVLLAYEEEQEKTLKQTLLAFEKEERQKIAIIVGPEGGFDPNEIKSLTAAGAHSVSLGKRILRTETAGLVMLSQLNFWKE